MGDDFAIRRILYATDCSPEAAHAAPFAVAFAEAFGTQIDVLNVTHSEQIGLCCVNSCCRSLVV